MTCALDIFTEKRSIRVSDMILQKGTLCHPAYSVPGLDYAPMFRIVAPARCSPT